MSWRKPGAKGSSKWRTCQHLLDAEEEEPKETNPEGRKKPGGCPQRTAPARREC